MLSGAFSLEQVMKGIRPGTRVAGCTHIEGVDVGNNCYRVDCPRPYLIFNLNQSEVVNYTDGSQQEVDALAMCVPCAIGWTEDCKYVTYAVIQGDASMLN